MKHTILPEYVVKVDFTNLHKRFNRFCRVCAITFQIDELDSDLEIVFEESQCRQQGQLLKDDSLYSRKSFHRKPSCA